jgi:hypothetical protein
MGRPMSGRRFTPIGTPAYVTASGLTDDEFRAGLKD